MKQFRILFAFCAVVTFASGCTAHRTSDSSSITSVQTNPVIYDVQTSVENYATRGVASHYKLLGIFTWGDEDYADFAFSVAEHNAVAENVESAVVLNILNPLMGLFSPRNIFEDLKKAATYDACKASGAYSLIGAKYEISTSNYLILRRVKCVVTGYPVKITGFKRVQSGAKTVK
ncbi:MAG: hypothetical protein IJV89_02185 [Lentisphaeria bacterium]|nr:hypothetical protein [Lentisphaeria bacterium]